MPGIPIDGDGKPNMQALIRRWGGYSRVPAEARFDQAMARFHQRRRLPFPADGKRLMKHFPSTGRVYK
jgi:hypothetical protein